VSRLTSSPDESTATERVVSITLAICAVLVVVLLLRRELIGGRPPQSANPVPERREDWAEIAAAGRLIGKPQAAIQVVEFSDLECPFCRRFHLGGLRAAKAIYGDEISIRYVHFLIPGHRFAEPAALAAECAGEQGRFAEMLDEIYAQQDSLGLRAWSSFATSARVADTAAFGQCISSRRGLEVIASGKRLGEQIKVPGTPTVVVNGWKFSPSPDSAAFLQSIERIQRGGKP
jgi:protein-disulfide isomerase